MNKVFKYGVALATSLFAINSYAVTVDSPTGKQDVPDNPQRIVVLDLSIADNLLALGQQHRVVGIADSKFFPAYLSKVYTDAKYKNVGLLVQPNLEAIAELKPDLIVTSGRQAKFLDQLKQIAPVYVATLDDTKQSYSIDANLLAVGKFTGQEAKAQELAKDLDAKIEALNKLASGKNALVLLTNDRKMSGFGPESRYSIVYKDFGFKPAGQIADAKGRHGVEVSYEFIQKTNPQFIFVVDRSAALTDAKDNAKNTLNNPLVNSTDAAKNNAIVYLDSKVWYLAYGGYYSTVEMINELSNAIKNAK
ncbi:hypothetical protein CJP74_01075 [Psittacicella melopsittaci]|uniref:Fe/B12 periplasmic-binding domain-containing protein n=1 Tax=Psittacicella melopsittaci TaxID=2028576 RepID=A0A3A1Y624_9GAMM|nr:ABC transporter substrate-binding protein [Psittacicella melopsittaci]RIY33703.1 hypothetical protein CJP74_01075 [Psittacicella melopsittaci]